MRKPTICIFENKDADQFCGSCTADQRLCFRHMDSTIPLLLISKVLCCDYCRKPKLLVFSCTLSFTKLKFMYKVKLCFSFICSIIFYLISLFLLFAAYKVGSSKEGWSEVYNFIPMQNGTNWSPRICLFGDFGLENSNHSLPRMLQEQKERMYDAIFHVGECDIIRKTCNLYPLIRHFYISKLGFAGVNLLAAQR